MEQQKDYSLLRPFDLEAAKRGELLCDVEARVFWSYVAGPDSLSKYILKVDHAPMSNGEFTYPTSAAPLRMAPLCWVEGKPVYKGDVLYQNTAALPGDRVVVDGNEDGIIDNQGRWNGRSHLTWTPPKVKREGWVNIVRHDRCGVAGELTDRIVRNCDIFPTKEAAERFALQCRDVLATVRIEWEEPAGTKGGAA